MLLLAIGVTFAVTTASTPLVLRSLRHRQILDHPNHRSSHTLPTPRGGGLAVATGVICGIATANAGRTWEGLVVATTAVCLGILGLVDDLRSVPAVRRLVLQAATAGAGILLLLGDMSGPPVWKVAVFAGGSLWIVSYVNAFNFMDGINGVSAAQVMSAGAIWAIAGRRVGADRVVAMGVVATVAALAFTPWNFPRAKVFIGDVGSYFLGGLLASVAIVALRSGIPPLVVLAPLVLYLADTSTTIVRRVRAGETWHLAHRSHVYQRLVSGGWSHVQTTGLVFAITLASGGIAIGASASTVTVQAASAAAIGAMTVVYLALPELSQMSQWKESAERGDG